MLFLNLETSLIDHGVVGSGVLINQVNVAQLSTDFIVMEIIETKLENIDALAEFIKMYREYGFSFALDDVGAGCSNLDRIPVTQPDILK